MAAITHWTQQSVDAFVHRIATDFASQLQTQMEEQTVTYSEFADSMCITPGRVSQILNNPGNLTLRNIVRCTRSLGKKVAIVAYDDGDAQNENGPVNSEIFAKCWEMSGKPADFFELAGSTVCKQVSVTIMPSSLCTTVASGASQADTAYSGNYCTGWSDQYTVSTHVMSGNTTTTPSMGNVQSSVEKFAEARA